MGVEWEEHGRSMGSIGVGEKEDGENMELDRRAGGRGVGEGGGGVVVIAREGGLLGNRLRNRRQTARGLYLETVVTCSPRRSKMQGYRERARRDQLLTSAPHRYSINGALINISTTSVIDILRHVT